MKIQDSTRNISSFWPFIIGLIFLIWIPHLLSLGMFMDGVFDAVTAENLYKGASSFWSPSDIHYSHPESWGSPPFAIYTLSVCYRLFGDHYVVERIYSLFCAIVQLVLIATLWITLFNSNQKLKSYSWLPCLLWLMSPLIGWSYSNNLLENTMALFTTLAIIISARYVISNQRMFLSAMAVAVVLIMGFISKGPVALFPLAMPVIMAGFTTGFNARRAFLFSALQVLLFAGCFILLFSFKGPSTFLHNYYDVQLKEAFIHSAGQRADSGNIFIELLLSSLVFILLAMLRTVMRAVRVKENFDDNGVALRMLLLGLCGSLPIALSAKQRGFYLLPAMVPFVIATAAYVVPLADWAELQIARFSLGKIIKWISAGLVVLAIVLCIVNRGVIVRDNDILNDIRSASSMVQNESVIRADWSFYGEWSLRAYWLRLSGKKLCMPDEQAPARFYMARPNLRGDKLPASATKIFAGKTFDLYRI